MRTLLIAAALLMGSATAVAQPPTGAEALNDPVSTTMEQLQEEHIATLKARANALVQMYHVGEELLENVTRAQLEVLEAQLEYANDKAERVRFAEASLASLKELERSLSNQFAAGTASPSQVLSVKASRLRAEIVLLRQKQKTEGEEQQREPQTFEPPTVPNAAPLMCNAVAQPCNVRRRTRPWRSAFGSPFRKGKPCITVPMGHAR